MNSPAASSNRSGRIRTTRRSSQPRFIVILPFAPLSQTSQTALPIFLGPAWHPSPVKSGVITMWWKMNVWFL